MLLTCSGMPSSMPVCWVSAAIVSASMYSSTSGSTPEATSAGTAAVTASSVANGSSKVARCVRRGRRRTRDLGDQGEHALGADDQLREIEAGRGLHELAAGADDLTGAEHRGQAEHVVARDAVLDGLHAAGVGGDVAAERAAALAGEDRIGEAVRARGVVELCQRDAGLDHRDVVVRCRSRRRASSARTRAGCRRGRGTQPPDRPVPLPRAVTGTRSRLASATMRATCSVLRRAQQEVGLAWRDA